MFDLSMIRHALRRLRSTPLVTVSAIACLAIGVWMTSIMSAIAFGFFRPNLHIPEPKRIVQLDELGLYSTDYYGGFVCCGRMASQPVVDSLARMPHFSAVGTYSGTYAYYLEGDERTYWTTHLSAGMMGVLRVVPQLGRGFIPADDTTGGVVMLSDHVWRSRYGADPAIVGRHLRFTGEATGRTIVGVMPADFIFPRSGRRADLYQPPRRPGDRWRSPGVQMLARLAEGVDVGDADRAAKTVAARRVAADRQEMNDWIRRTWRRSRAPEVASGGVVIRLERYVAEPVPPASAIQALILIIACGFAVVGIAAANVVNLLLVRGAARRQEIAVRMALGAGRWRVIRELVVESALLAVPAVLIGLVAAERQWAAISPSYFFRHRFGEIDGRIAMIAVGGGIAIAILVGIWPAVRATSQGLEHVMRDARRSGFTVSPLDGALGRLVAVSTAATVVLLVSAVLLGLSARDAGQDFVPRSASVLASDLTFSDHEPRDARVALARETLTRLRGLPGVHFAALGGTTMQSLVASTTDAYPTRRMGAVEITAITDGYFETMSIPLLRGRSFSAREARDSIGAVVIDRELAQTLFPGRHALGERFRYRRYDDSTIVEAEVIGVAEHAGERGTLPQMYVSLGSSPVFTASAFARYRPRTPPRPGDVATMLRSRTGLTATTVTSLAAKSERSDPGRRYLTLGFTMFAVVGLVLAVVGTYGVVAYSVERRTHEIGVRMALGAERVRVVRLVIEHGMKITLVGLIAGLLLSIGAMSILGSAIQEVRLGYPAAIAGVIVVVVALSLIASAIPAWRAGRLNPVDALRAE